MGHTSPETSLGVWTEVSEAEYAASLADAVQAALRKRVSVWGGHVFWLTDAQIERVAALTDEQRDEFITRAKDTRAYRGPDR